MKNEKLSKRFGAVVRGDSYSEKVIREAMAYAETDNVLAALERAVYGAGAKGDFHLLGQFEIDLHNKGL